MKIPITSIRIPEDRFRKEIDEIALRELKESLANVGLIHPIIVSQGKLIAGQRRLLSAIALGWTEIEAREWESLDYVEQKLVEFEENRKRHALTWQEEAAAVAEIHRLLIEKDKRRLKTPDDPGHTLAETARALGVSQSKVGQDVALANALKNEKVASRPSREGAYKTMIREREMELVKELARRRAATLTGNIEGFSVQRSGAGTLYQGDCLDVVRKMEADSVDLIFMDPPWGIDLPNASQWLRRWVPSYNDSLFGVRKLMLALVPELYRVLKPTCHLYTFFPIQDLPWWIDTLGEAGFQVRPRPLIWFKEGQPSVTDTYTAFQATYEAILWAFKADEDNVRRFFSCPVADGYGYRRPQDPIHENEKPVELCQKFIEASTDVNDIVLDPFAGGGSTLEAAFALGRYYIGIELDEINYEKAGKRLQMAEETRDNKDDDSTS